MILVDANLLLYAHDASDGRHEAARGWLERTLASEPDVRFSLATLLPFVRIATDPRVYEQPMTAAEAIAVVESLLSRSNVSIASPGDRHWTVMAELAESGRARGPLLMDAHLAALATEHGATLATTDRDFGRFRGLRSVDPLSA